MKKLFSTSILVILFTVLVFAQKKDQLSSIPQRVTTISANELQNLPHSKGNWQFILQQNLNYSNTNQHFDGEKIGRLRNLGVTAGANYFIIDHIAVGMEIDADLLKTVDVISKDEHVDNSWMVYGNVRAQTQFSPGFNGYAQAGVGIGKASFKDSYMGNSTSHSDNLFGIKVEVGAPIALYGNSFAHVTPFVSYNRNTSKHDDFKDTESGVRIGARLEAYLGCGDMSCDMRQGFRLSKDRYKKGSSFIDYSTFGFVEFGKASSSYSGGSGTTNEQNYSNNMLGLQYQYYIVDNFAVGAGFQYGHNSIKNKASDNKNTWSSYLVSPTITYNFPGSNCWNNFSLEGSVGFGSTKSENKVGNFTNTEKHTVFNYGFNFCYNDFFAKKIALTPKLGYQWGSIKESDADDDEKVSTRGIVFGLGVRKYF